MAYNLPYIDYHEIYEALFCGVFTSSECETLTNQLNVIYIQYATHGNRTEGGNQNCAGNA